jgi:hypothetical protein
LQNYGIKAEDFTEIEASIKNYKKHMYLPVQQVKEKARLAKTARRLIADIKKFAKANLVPFFKVVATDKNHIGETFNFNSLFAFKFKSAGRPKGSKSKKSLPQRGVAHGISSNVPVEATTQEVVHKKEVKQNPVKQITKEVAFLMASSGKQQELVSVRR